MVVNMTRTIIALLILLSTGALLILTNIFVPTISVFGVSVGIFILGFVALAVI